MRIWLSFVALLLSSLTAFAADPIGYVKTLTGKAEIVTAGKPAAAAIGSPVYMGSELNTGASSSLGVTFKDGTMMSFGSNTKMTVDEYLYAPTQGNAKLQTKLTKGTLNYVSGAIAKLKPENVGVQTPSGLIGVRGTHFAVKVDE